MSFWVCPVCPALSLRPSVLYNIETTQPLELSRCTDRRVFRASHWCSFLGGENRAGGKMGQLLRCWMCKAPQGPHWIGASGRESCWAYFMASTKTPVQMVLHSADELVSLPTQSLNSPHSDTSSAFSIPSRAAPMSRTKGAALRTHGTGAPHGPADQSESQWAPKHTSSPWLLQGFWTGG